ncbi:hypothetical protein [uncultured Sulfitobacter sp.]|uniref:DUF3108 domain-containing protein n=1 Tax=uncultured Sulfitobacter sp. TaxID=191468 RepID=UPI002638FD07|nr:hypothetical protein [uncultured Sulfitobacter sp.]
MRYLAALCFILCAPPALAQDFDVTLAGKPLGLLSFEAKGQRSTLRSTLNNTPLGVFNGTFVGVSKGSGRTARFTGDSKSSRKQRRVMIDITNGRATATNITPASEQTDLSDINQVPAGVLDPVEVISRLIRAEGCPEQMRLYDGRRVVALATTGQNRQEGSLTCALSYKVIAGPGHLSPLRISQAKIQLRYVTTDNAQTLEQMKISSGIFSLSLDRRE